MEVVFLATYTLDFSLTTDTDRLNYITQICSQTTYTAKQYSQMADYILLAHNKNHPDLPFIYPEEFNNPKRLHPTESLDELLENSENDEVPIVLESTIQPIQPNIYKREIRKIDRSNYKVASLPNMQFLWDCIDNIKLTLDSINKESREYYKLHKFMVQLQQQQYSILECCMPLKPLLYSVPPKQEMYNWENGILLNNGEKAYLDLCNIDHMSSFLYMLPSLFFYSVDKPSSTLYELVHDTIAALHNAPLTPIHWDILNLHYNGMGNGSITQYINKKYNKKYSQAYVSTILHKQIPAKVVPEYTEIYFSKLYANYKPMWRTCLSCHQTKLLTPHNFFRKSNKPGGFSMRCKECDKKHTEELAAKRSLRVKSGQND